MAASLLFVHGTGVRAPGFASSLRLIREQVAKHQLPLEVHGCYWGEAEGARLRAGGASIPGFAETGGALPTAAEEKLALWTMLYLDPWYELRLLRHYPAAGPLAPGQAAPGPALIAAINSFTPSADLRRSLADIHLDEAFDRALADLRGAPELREAADTAPAAPIEHRGAIARALIAQTLDHAADADAGAIDGATRDVLVTALTTELHGDSMGVGDFLKRSVTGLGARLVTRKLVGDRGSVTDAAAPAAGDILRFLAQGDGARQFIAAAISDLAPGPVFVLAHSLGGIMCVDLLARQQLPVAGLITAGSQSPFLYEIGALPGLTFGTELPSHFPPWLNLYDRKDILSYLGNGVFADRVHDVPVDNGQPFPQAHSAYWANPAVWAAVGEFVA